MEPSNNELMQAQTPKKPYAVSLLVVLVVIALVEFVLLMNRSAVAPGAVTNTSNQEATQKEEMFQKAGAFTLSADKMGGQYRVGDTITLTMTADSAKKGVVGFDAVMLFDASTLTYQGARSQIKGFTTVGSVRRGYLEVTSAKDPQTLITPVLADTEVVSVSFTAKKAGQYKVSLMDVVDQSSTKFVDSETTMYLPQLNEVTITVK